MMKKWLMGSLVWAFLSSVSVHAAEADINAASVRKMMNLGADYSVVYQDAQGKTMTESDFFASLKQSGKSMQIIKKPAEKSAIIKLSEHAPKELVENYKLKPGEKIPAFTLKNLSGTDLDLSLTKAKPTLISFYFAECGPCVAEVPTLNQYKEKYSDVDVIAVTFDQQAEAQGFVDKYKFTWPIYAEAKAFIARLGIHAYPSFALVAANGELLGMISASKLNENSELSQVKLQRWVADLLKEKT